MPNTSIQRNNCAIKMEPIDPLLYNELIVKEEELDIKEEMIIKDEIKTECDEIDEEIQEHGQIILTEADTYLTVDCTNQMNDKRFQCGICTKLFTRQAAIIKHIKMHIVEKPFRCTICEKSFQINSLLQRHLKTHTKKPRKKSLICRICSKKFLKHNILDEHYQSHLNERPYKCNSCDRTYATENDLNLHERTHNTNHISFKCCICDKKISSKSNLKIHLRLHTGECPYHCTHCNQVFSHKASLNRHVTECQAIENKTS